MYRTTGYPIDSALKRLVKTQSRARRQGPPPLLALVSWVKRPGGRPAGCAPAT
jgi:hypothetical protein